MGGQNTITSTLELFGDPDVGDSATARSVGVTCGIATQMLLDGVGAMKMPGVLAPYSRDICEPIRVKLETEGIKLTERMYRDRRAMRDSTFSSAAVVGGMKAMGKEASGVVACRPACQRPI